jgi:flagellar biosynthesis protein
VAERILEVAREHGIAVRSDPGLVSLLAACEPGDEIPAEAWAVVAEILSWLYRLEQETGGAA